MTGRTITGEALTPGRNVDPVNIEAGVDMATRIGYLTNELDGMVVVYSLQRHARGEEGGAQRSWMDHFGRGGFESWRMVLTAAVSSGTAQLRAVTP